ncbi:Eco57I restriction-modification methylase domain-containing protein [Ferrimicrobium acidiphilum]|uniref:site-specific DNA-methyltransferase (adenine-specific) n=2 Tax=Ferrimicrobium TaxID=121038 RepID=A0ABV3Y3G8_9ACTN
MRLVGSSNAVRAGCNSSLPGQMVERGSFSIIGQLHRLVAYSAIRADCGLTDVPLWATQATLFALSLRHGFEPGETSVRSFVEFVRRCAEYGSRVFPDGSLWPADHQGVMAVVELLASVDDGQLMMLVGRTLDYGRTLEWNADRYGTVVSRNLVTAKVQGIFYTPLFIARHLAVQCLASVDGIRCPLVLDPAVGGGAFLLAAAEILLRQFDPVTVRASLFGTDTDPIAVEVAAILVEAACGTWEPGRIPTLLNVNFQIGDAFGGPVFDDGPALPGAISWKSAFPQVFGNERRGFDVVLINPPFGRHKVDSDWLIAKEMKLDALLLDKLSTSGRQRALDLRASGYYPLSSMGVLDKARIGLERAMQLTANGGDLGAVVPSTIAADSHSFLLRESLLVNWNMTEIDEFPETARLFYDVSQSVSILHAKKGSPTTTVRVRSGVKHERELSKAFTAEWPIELLTQVSPKLAIPLRMTDPMFVLERVHRHPPLRDMVGVINARGEVDVSAFEDALTDDIEMIPLVRGDQIDCFRSDLPSDKKAFVDTDEFTMRLARSPKFQHFRRDRIVGRQCSYLYRPKRLSFAYVDAERAVANSCNYLSFEAGSELLLYLLGLLNSSLLNWRFKVTNSNNHVSNAELAELPIPDPARAPSSLVTRICEQADSLSSHPNADACRTLDELVYELYGLNASQGHFVSLMETSR